MKLTGDLKKQVETAQTKEEAKDLIKKAGMELTDDELEQVAGGTGLDLFYDEKRKEVTDEPDKPEIWLQKNKLDDIPPSGQEYAKLPF